MKNQEPLFAVPDFSLASSGGETFSLSSFGDGFLVLYFYPRDFTPGCTSEAMAFKELYPRFQELGLSVFGVSRDSVSSHEKFLAKLDLPFALLSDPEALSAHLFGVMKEKTNFGKKALGIERSTFLLDGRGRVWRAWRRVKVKDHAALVLQECQKVMDKDHGRA